MDEQYRRLNMPTFSEWLTDVEEHANERGDHVRQAHVRTVRKLASRLGVDLADIDRGEWP